MTTATEVKKINKSELGPNFSLFGGKGNVWSGTAHIYKSGSGNLCGTPALSTNWVAIEMVTEAGCPECIEAYNKLNKK